MCTKYIYIYFFLPFIQFHNFGIGSEGIAMFANKWMFLRGEFTQ